MAPVGGFVNCNRISWIFALAASAFAQTDATVSGTITDPSGAHIVNATVTALNTSTGVATTSHTNDAGVYVFPALPPGTYRISAEHSGFRKTFLNDVVLAVGSQLTANLPLDIGQTTETVEVQAAVTEVNASSATLGAVVESRKILELPLVGRSAYDLLNTQPGVITTGAESVNINGQQTGAINYTTDGINTQDNLLNGAFNANVSNTVSIDRVEEFRVVSSPADAEYGRGGAQVQLVTRGGTNQFHGSAWEEFRNTDLNANDWFNNASGVNPFTGAMNAPRNVLVRNQYGTRLGGPVKKNRTFFNGIWEEDRQNQRVATNPTVLTPTALQGMYRFFPGAQNQNATGVAPTVSTSGNPIQPASATGPLQTISVFGKDPNRLAPDPTGQVTKLLSLMPAPNNYLAGDGLNTAGFLWSRPVVDDFQLFEGRIDHIFNFKHRITITLNHQSYDSLNVANAQPFPKSPGGLAPTETTQYSAAFTSTLKPSLLNEIRIGVFRPRVLVFSEYDPLAGPSGVAGLKLLPTSNGTPFYLGLAAGESNPLSPAATSTGTTSNRISQTYQYGDDLTWIKGKHSFKGGFVARLINNAGYDNVGVVPTASIGAQTGALAVTGINTIPGIGLNSGGATNLLLDLNGSLSSANAVLNSPGGTNPQFIPGETRYSNLLSHEYSFYVKDDWKVTPNFTLNLGVRYEYYGVPVDADGRMQALAGGGAGIFGVSGTNFGALFNPGASSGSLTQVQLIGPQTNNPNTQLYNSDLNNFGPAIGFAWSLGDRGPHWLTGGRNQTVIRSGYGISYIRNALYVIHMYNSYEPDGLATTVTQTSTSLLNLSNIKLPITTTQTPLFTEPISGLRSQSVYSFQNNLVNPYTQNFNFSIQRELTPATLLTVAYVGNVGDKLLRAYDINEVNILAQSPNGETFLQAFNTVRAGGDSKFMDSLGSALGLNSATMRLTSTFQGYLSNNNPAGLAALLNGSLGGLVPGGTLVKAAGLPVNFFVANPQFSPFPFGTSAVLPGGAYTVDNSGHSDYHSLQVTLQKRLTHGFTYQGSYVWSKVIGDSAAGESAIYLQDFRTLRNEALDKGTLSFNHAGVIKINGLYELPFGPGKPWAGNSHGLVSRLVGGWQIGAIFTYFTGAPLTLIGSEGLNTNYNGISAFTGNATQVGPISSGVQKVGNGVIYFPGATQTADPQVAGIAAGAANGNLQALSTLRSISINGTPALINAAPGSVGGLAYGSLNGPGGFRLDFNLLKRIKLTERFTMELRATATNLTNSPVFGSPQININSTTFGHITGDAGPRIIVAQLRLNF
jgi:hypothetical protein